MVERGVRDRADGEDERVVRQLGARAQPHAAPRAVHAPDAVARERDAEGAGELGEVVVVGAAEAERLEDAEGAERERLVGRDERGRDALAGERVQRDERLEPGDAAADDDDAQSASRGGVRMHARSIDAGGRALIRGNPQHHDGDAPGRPDGPPGRG